MNRRFFLEVITGASGAVLLGGSQLAMASNEVRLLVIRQVDYADRCTRCIPGKLYGVPASIELETAEAFPAALEFITDVIEPSYEDNQPNLSSVPVGTYPAKIRTDGTKRWMWSGGAVNSGSLIENRSWRLELSGVTGGRSAIQFHYGKDAGWSAGCIIVGRQPQNQCVDQCKFADSPEAGVVALRAYVESRIVASNSVIQVRIANAVW